MKKLETSFLVSMFGKTIKTSKNQVCCKTIIEKSIGTKLITIKRTPEPSHFDHRANL
jgi:hypothetical protein